MATPGAGGEISIPYGCYWSTPFARWQGSLAHLHSLQFAAWVAKDALARRSIDVSAFDHAALGMTVPQRGCFYGLPWLMGQIGATAVAGPTINQACATGARLLQSCAAEIRDGNARVSLAISADRTSNGPHLYYPSPQAAGGTGEAENWVLDNFGCDPFTGLSMVQTAENVAARRGIGTGRQNELTLRRYAQYQDALADGSSFLRRYMDLPFAVPDSRFKRTQGSLDGDEGIHPTTAQGLAALKPLVSGGTVTYGGQTHPADGSAAIVLTTPERARELSRDAGIDIRIRAFGQARVEPGHMPAAPVPAARQALRAAGLQIDQMAAIKTHNPFVLNDLILADDFGIDPMEINNYGSSLVWGHPQGPTGLRSVIELIEELVIRGGGYGLFTGCAAGDSAMAVILQVGDRR
ncbi:MAG: thiolase family protein [Lautropia sp.]|nr:thiolase family protein [Lautropia sp.]